MKQPISKLEPLSALILIVLLGFTGYVWFSIFSGTGAHVNGNDIIHFLDVEQGDSQLLSMGPVQMITDFGPDMAITRSLAATLPSSKRRIDIALITHPEKDHYGGLRFLLDQYDIGVVLWNGYEKATGVSPEWDDLQRRIRENHIPMIAIGAGDTIRYAGRRIAILSPDPLLLGGGSTNEGGIVQNVFARGFTALLTADTGFTTEQYLLSKNINLSADILKIGHHGSKYSSSDNFLRAVNPRIAVIQVGKGNTYGHPSPETLSRLASSTTATVLRNDEKGTISVWRDSITKNFVIATDPK